MQKIRRDDEVIIITGKDKSRRGKVIKLVADGTRILVEGINMVKKHVRPNPNKNEQGGILQREAPLHISNVALYNPATKKGDRVGIRVLEDGQKVRYFKSNDEVIDV